MLVRLYEIHQEIIPYKNIYEIRLEMFILSKEIVLPYNSLLLKIMKLSAIISRFMPQHQHVSLPCSRLLGALNTTIFCKSSCMSNVCELLNSYNLNVIGSLKRLDNKCLGQEVQKTKPFQLIKKELKKTFQSHSIMLLATEKTKLGLTRPIITIIATMLRSHATIAPPLYRENPTAPSKP